MATILERLASELRKEEEGERTAAQEQRIAKLEAQLSKAQKEATPEEREDAIEEITDEEYELIRQHRAGKTAPPKVEEPPAEETKPKRTRPGRQKGKAYGWTVDENGRVQKTDIAHIYSGEDEPDEVELPDEEEMAA